VGHPFQRALSLDGTLRRRLASGRCHAVVDEGPGLSGSSMAAVADGLVAARPGRSDDSDVALSAIPPGRSGRFLDGKRAREAARLGEVSR
jgi:hypothetical protein